MAREGVGFGVGCVGGTVVVLVGVTIGILCYGIGGI
jgi:hypothetical protein